MKIWNKVFLITLIIVGILILVSIRFVNFSETNGKVLDDLGNPVSGVKVMISYGCDENKIVDSDLHSFKQLSTVTDDKGDFFFDKFNTGLITRFRFPGNCVKIISAYREGYCNDIELCTREIQNGGYSEEQLNSWGDDKSIFLFRNGTYYDSAHFNTAKTIGIGEKNINLKLNRLFIW